jgi:hypothetical protein
MNRMFGKIKSTFLEKKSYQPTPSGFYSFYDNYTGEIIGGVQKLSLEAEINKNFAIQTVISNQLRIINDCELYALQKDKNNTDAPTTYKPALDFLDILNRPNSYPAPKHWNDIVEGVYKSYISNGIVGIILVGGLTKSIENIEVANCVQYRNNNDIISYNISTIGTGYKYNREFVKNEELGAFVNGNDIAIIFGNFDYNTKTYKSPLEHIQDVILWQNYIIHSSRVFYENSCRPSSIITVKFLKEEGKISNDPRDEEKMQKIMKTIAAQLKGTNNNGKVFLANHPNIEIDVKQISVVQNANDIEKQLALTKQMIYSTFAGANTNVIEGVSEYSNNRLASLREFYDGTISGFTDMILDDLNAFLQKWLKYVGAGSDILIRKGVYLSFDIKMIQFYKDLAKQEILKIAEKQIIKKQEARTKLGEIDDSYANLEILTTEDDGFIGEKKPNTL